MQEASQLRIRLFMRGSATTRREPICDWSESRSVVSVKRIRSLVRISMGNGGIVSYVYLATDWICG